MTLRILFALAFLAAPFGANAESMKMAVTTSFHNSGLSDVLLPAIQQDLGLDVQLLVVGTGQALKLGRAGDVDAVLVHSRKAEEAFIADGSGTHRREIMFNDFVVIGPADDPAMIAKSDTAAVALQAVASTKSTFVSRGDNSGTHKTELSLWSDAGLDTSAFGEWYNAVGAGMGSALNVASGLNAYILADRASWLNFGNRGDLALLFAGDPVLFNQYAYLPVNPAKHPHVNTSAIQQLETWLTGPTAADLINSYQINGETLFTFNARPN